MSKSYQHIVAPGALDFALHTLGWRNFQDLCAVVLRQVLGQTVKSFADSNDGGRDGAFLVGWQNPEVVVGGKWTGIPEGSTVVQCKFMTKVGKNLVPSDVDAEIEKIKRLVEKGICTNYVLMTNAAITGTSDAKIIKRIKDCGVKHALILDGRWICQTISLNQDLRLYVPRVYGLGDLTKIIDERAYSQAHALLDYLKDDLSTFVVTDAYTKAATALKDHSFVFLIGEPASGKSIIAASLAMAAVDRWKCLTVKVNGPKELLEHWDPNESNQFFWIDDAFGATSYDRSLTDEWVHALPQVGAAVKRGAKVVITSRDYIYKEASNILKEYAYPFLREQKVEVHVADLSEDEKQKILYNHIRLGDHTNNFKSNLKPHLTYVAAVNRFLPEVARRLGSNAFSGRINPTDKYQVVQFMERPSDFLLDVFKELPQAYFAALCLVYQSGTLRSPVVFTELHSRIMNRLGQNEANIVQALQSLEGTFLRLAGEIDGEEYKKYWSFKHPTLREGLAYFLSGQPELLDVLIEGMTFDELFTQIDCGNKKHSYRVLKIPATHYGYIIDRCAAFYDLRRQSQKVANDYMLILRQHQFLASASPVFLRSYLARFSSFINELLEFGGQLAWDPRLMVLGSLKEYNLLSEGDRKHAADRIQEIALDTPDASWLDNDSCNHILTDTEKQKLIAQTRELLNNGFDDVLNNWKFNEGSDDLEAHYAPLLETLDGYVEYFEEDRAMLEVIGYCRDGVERRIAEKRQGEKSRNQWKIPDLKKQEVQSTERSIFEDVDAD